MTLRLAILSNIHGQWPALRLLLDTLAARRGLQVSDVICLGDLCAAGAISPDVLDLAPRFALCLRGDWEAFVASMETLSARGVELLGHRPMPGEIPASAREFLRTLTAGPVSWGRLEFTAGDRRECSPAEGRFIFLPQMWGSMSHSEMRALPLGDPRGDELRIAGPLPQALPKVARLELPGERFAAVREYSIAQWESLPGAVVRVSPLISPDLSAASTECKITAWVWDEPFLERHSLRISRAVLGSAFAGRADDLIL